MAESAVSFAIERLGDLLIHECKFLSGVSDEIEEIKVELRRMQCFLKDADKRQDENKSVQNWIAEIKDLAFKTENVLETFAVEIASKREGSGIKNIIRRFSCIIGEGIARHKVGSEIGKIKKKITSLTRSLETYGIRDLANGESSSSASHKELFLRAKYPHVIEEDFIGMKKDEERLVSHLISLHKHDGVITIKGMGGQGKTTIATRIYNRTDIRHNFSSFAWVCVTQQCQKKIIWQDILKQLLPERMADIMQMGDTQLAEVLYKVQQEKKCLVILDDIWSIEDWHSLNPAFPIGGTDIGSKLLLTTRKLDTKVGVVHALGGLDEDEGWMLLKKKTFPGKYDDPEFRIDPKMVKLGRDIVNKCEGLPLAISVLGGLLKDKTTLREWETVRENISSYLRRGEGIHEEDYETVTQVLALSYNDLPYFLKPCFLYLGLFPEDFDIEVELLCLLWIAEGFVSSDHRGEGETMMDVAERYLDELARRSMVQVKLISNKVYSPSITRRFESCRLHDLMRDMCLLKGEKEDFLKIMDHRSRLGNGGLILFTSSSSRRLAVYFHSGVYVKIPSKQPEIIMRIRSLLLMGPYFAREEVQSEIPGINEFKFLLVLNVRGLTFVDYKVLERISELIHLRHLSFNGCHIKKFPSSIFTLRYLQTLDLRVRHLVKVIIPNTLGRMKQLRHLFLPESYCVEGDQKLRLDGLLQLEVLDVFNPTMCSVEDVGERLKKLGVFRAKVEENLEDLPSLIKYINAASSCHLRKTTLIIGSSIFSSENAFSLLQDLFGCLALHELSIFGPIAMLPKPDHHHQFSSSLTYITLWCSELKEDPMETLEKLPNLRKLDLHHKAFVGKEMVCSTNGFPQLRSFTLDGLSNIEKWHVEDGAMPNLEYLIIFKCEKLEMLPGGLKFLHSLKELRIVRMLEAFKNRVRVVNGVEGEDFDKVRHVPSIILNT